MEFHEEHAHLNLLAVTPEDRRHHIGSALLKWLEDSAKVAGIARINLEVRTTNKSALSFYRNHHYQLDREIQGYYRGKEKCLWDGAPPHSTRNRQAKTISYRITSGLKIPV